ncbi:flagellar motor switch protein FliN [Chelativorans sp. Marseille-P2723]|uniref:flagellar motor switch protein FliN n=1 Tax=Chelativorans sp. Marseille-P2723 TaxID=2709133 RepID=UPI00156F095F|nr:flagellar motor switch protein FliN [Chelativorans sp. Marseille-P2723]
MSSSRTATKKNASESLNQAIDEMRNVLHDDAAQKNDDAGNAPLVMGIPVEVQVMLGSAEMTVSELMALQRGCTVTLDRRIGEPVEIVVNGRRIARGEITVLEEDPSRFGVRLTEIGGSAQVE